MNSVDTFHKRLRDEIAAVEKEIQSHNQQVESLTNRLKGLKRADELFESDQAAIAELLQTGIANGGGITREMATAPAATMRRAAVSPKATGAQKQLGRRTQAGQGKMQTGRAPARRNAGLTRLDMITAVELSRLRQSANMIARLANGSRASVIRFQTASSFLPD
jgi:cell division septum initiation protein DivIVA